MTAFLRPLCILGIFAAVLLTAIAAGRALAGDRVTFSATAAETGDCTDPTATVIADWAHRSDGLDVDARLRTGPSAADCRTDGLSYHVAAERRREIWQGVDAMARFSARRHSIAAPYAVTEGGDIKRRADGRPAHVVTLPAGAVESLEATLGASWNASGWLRLAAGVNLAPVDWADGSSGRTVHLGIHAERPLLAGIVAASLTAEVGSEAYGQARAEWRRPLAGGLSVTLSAVHDWGLDALADDAPETQNFAGLPVTLAGSPAASATTLAVGIGWEF